MLTSILQSKQDHFLFSQRRDLDCYWGPVDSHLVRIRLGLYKEPTGPPYNLLDLDQSSDIDDYDDVDSNTLNPRFRRIKLLR